MKGNKGSLKSMKIRLLSGLSLRCKIISLPLSVKKTGILPSASRFFWNKTVQRMRSPRRAIAGPDMTNEIHMIEYTNCHMEIFNKNINFPEIKFQLPIKTVWLICCQFSFWIFTSFCLLLLLGISCADQKTTHKIGNFGEIFVTQRNCSVLIWKESGKWIVTDRVSRQQERCASVFLVTCNLILFNAEINWLPGSASPHVYIQAASTLILLLIFSLS